VGRFYRDENAATNTLRRGPASLASVRKTGRSPVRELGANSHPADRHLISFNYYVNLIASYGPLPISCMKALPCAAAHYQSRKASDSPKHLFVDSAGYRVMGAYAQGSCD
jgi:hypothetical protein